MGYSRDPLSRLNHGRSCVRALSNHWNNYLSRHDRETFSLRNRGWEEQPGETVEIRILFDGGPRPYVEIASKSFHDTKPGLQSSCWMAGCQAAKMEGTPVGLSLKTEGGGSGDSGDEERSLQTS